MFSSMAKFYAICPRIIEVESGNTLKEYRFGLVPRRAVAPHSDAARQNLQKTCSLQWGSKLGEGTKKTLMLLLSLDRGSRYQGLS